MNLVDKFLHIYLKNHLCDSIKVNFDDWEIGEYFSEQPGWGKDRGSMDWEERVSAWIKNGCDFIDEYGSYITNSEVRAAKLEDVAESCVPVFPNYANRAFKTLGQRYPKDTSQYSDYKALFLQPTNTVITGTLTTGTITADLNNKEQTKMNKLLDKALNVNKDAAKQAAKLSAGKTANQFVLSKLMGKLPWYAKLFGKKNDLAHNPVAKLVTANVATLLAANFANGNKKLEYVAEAMVQDAVLDLSYNSEFLESLLKQLETMVDIPNFEGIGEPV